MSNQEDKTTKMTPADHGKKLAHWIRHECKKDHPQLEERIAKGLAGNDGGKALMKWFKDDFKIEHPQLQLAIDNTIKAIG